MTMTDEKSRERVRAMYRDAMYSGRSRDADLIRRVSEILAPDITFDSVELSREDKRHEDDYQRYLRGAGLKDDETNDRSHE